MCQVPLTPMVAVPDRKTGGRRRRASAGVAEQAALGSFQPAVTMIEMVHALMLGGITRPDSVATSTQGFFHATRPAVFRWSGTALEEDGGGVYSVCRRKRQDHAGDDLIGPPGADEGIFSVSGGHGRA